LRSCGPGVSKTSDNDDATAPLGDSEVSSVQNPPAEPIPEAGQVVNDDGEVSSVVDGEKTRHVLTDEPGGTVFSQQAHDMRPQP
jgi:hypothetical protein